MKFGEDAYYSAPEGHKSSAVKGGSFESRVEGIVIFEIPDAEDRVKKTVRSWNEKLRHLIRSETGFRFVAGNQRTGVSVRVTNGLPEPLQDRLRDIDPVFIRLRLNYRNLSTTVDSLRFLQDSAPEIENFFEDQNPFLKLPRQSLSESEKTIRDILEGLKDDPILTSIKELHGDVLGAYFFHQRRIEIYWVVIALVAHSLDVSLEGLTLVVLIHELAHAYSHLGFDIDHNQWNTDDFAFSEIEICEGIAQYYTAVCCERLQPQIPEAFIAYKSLLKIQPKPYTVHDSWGESLRQIGEAVRTAMMECRNTPILEYESFSEEIARLSKLLKRKANPNW